jgi:transcriptional regulator with GAF, ATPase, and Fis domain
LEINLLREVMSTIGRTPQIWVHWHGGAKIDVKEPGLESLSRSHLDLCRRGEADEPAGGLFIFSEFTPEACQSLHDLTANNLDRVVALAVGAELSGATSWKLLEAGAADVLSWDEVSEAPSDLAARFERWATIEQILHSPAVQETLVGESRVWVAVLREVIEIACFTESAVLITGETGTGKELVARLIHTLDKRPGKRDLVVLDCTTVVPELSGSEFFGHERGAFTHAVTMREGAFALADGGTLFLDEVGELPSALQAELLRVVQEHVYKRVGSNTWKTTSFRLICATHQDLRWEEQRGNFRADFYHRIASWTCRLPSLEERREDIIPLTLHFLGKLTPDRKAPRLTPSVRDYLLLRKYPGNVRELRQLATRIAYRHVGKGPISVGDIPEEERVPAAHLMSEGWCDEDFAQAIRHALLKGATLREIGSKAAETAVRLVLEDESNNLPRAARKLGVTDRALQLRRAADRRREGQILRGHRK